MAHAQTPTAPFNVLVADDDPSIVRLVRHCLLNEGFEVRTASDGRQALEAIRSECPDLLITDWDMPFVNGLELVRTLRQESLPQYVYTLFLTSRVDPSDTIEALSSGADDFLLKPIERGDLMLRMKIARRALERVRHDAMLAETDALTGLHNRRSFEQYCEREIAVTLRQPRPLSLAMLDIDHFKSINDRDGHAVGDLVLQVVATVLSERCRRTDRVCRLGGDEFCILLPGLDEATATVWAERVLHAVTNISVPAAGSVVSVSATMGVATWNEEITSSKILLEMADEALLTAKRTGRGRVEKFSQLHGWDTLQSVCSGFRTARAVDVMTAPIVTLSRDQLLRDAADLFLRMRINSAPVVDAEGLLCGIISEKDLLAATIAGGGWNQQIHTTMKTNVVRYEEDTPAIAICEFLNRVTFRRVVVVRDGVPTGVISRGTLLRWLGNWSQVRQQAQLPKALFDRDQLIDASRQISAEMSKLENYLVSSGADPVAGVVSTATKVQEFALDLLANSQVHNAFVAEESQLSDGPLYM